MNKFTRCRIVQWQRPIWPIDEKFNPGLNPLNKPDMSNVTQHMQANTRMSQVAVTALAR